MAVVLNLDKPRALKFGVTAAREYRRVYGASLVVTLKQLSVQLSAGENEMMLDLDLITGLLWATLRHGDRNLTPDNAATLLDGYLEHGGKVETVFTAIAEAFAEATKQWGFGAGQEETGKEPTSTPSS